jgi:predicted MFS family arabinose efflux permease
LAGAEAVSMLGSWLTVLAVYSKLIFDTKADAEVTADVFLVAFLPSVLLSRPVGKLADRVNRKRLLITAELAAAFAVSVLFVADDRRIIYVALALRAAFNCVAPIARQALVKELVAPNAIVSANALITQLTTVVRLVGPAVAGAAVAALGFHLAIAVDVISYCVAAAVLTSLPRRAGKTPRESAASPGVAPIMPPERVPELRFLGGFVFLLFMAATQVDLLASPYTRDVLHAGAATFGWLLTTMGVGILAAALWSGRWGRAVPSWTALWVGLAMFCAIPAVFAAMASLEFSHKHAVVFGAAAIGGLGQGLMLIHGQSVLQRFRDASTIGSAAGSLQTMLVAGQLTGSLVTRFVSQFSISLPVYFSAILVVLVAVLIALGYRLAQRTLREHPGPLSAFP